MTPRLLEPDEPPPFEVVRPSGSSRALLICDHASSRLPRALGDLGLSDADRHSHIGWDIGAANVARSLSGLLDAPLVLSGYSRLAIDCNRPPDVAASIPAVTCEIAVPGNVGLDDEARRARQDALFWPYHRAIEALLASRRAAAVETEVLSIHSFTPSLYGVDRPWHVGLLYGNDASLARAFMAELGRDPAIVVGDNEPYRVTPTTDYGVPVYGEQASRPAVLVELRQDLVADDSGALRWAERLATAYRNIVALRG